MRKLKRWRYYCDHCNRAGGSRFHMAKHEAGCTLNPNRACGMCYHSGVTMRPLLELIATLGNGLQPGMDALRSACENCPACILAAIRQSKTLEVLIGGDVEKTYMGFNFTEEAKDFWVQVNEDRARNECY